MKKYEIMAIIANDMDEKAAQAHAESAIVQRIKDLGGNITFEDFWGARGFAYQINKQKWGYYFVAQFDIESVKTLELRRELNIDNSIVRTLITIVDKNAPAPRKYADMKKEYEAQEKKDNDEKIEAEEAKTAKKEKLSTVKPETKKEEPKKEEAPKDEVDEAIDKVLDDATADL